MWNLFKAQLMAEYSPTTYLIKDLNKLGRHGRYIEPLYQRHIDITSGGRLLPRIGLPQAFEYYFKAVAIANRFGLSDNNPNLSNQLKIQHLAYWTGRIIDSPTAIVITLFPGIWTDIFFKPNFLPSAKKWIDALSLSMYLQKCSVLGIRISKVPPFIVTPWSGFMYKSLDGGLSLGSIVGSILDQFNLTLDVFSAIIYRGDTSVLNPLKGIYANAISSVLTPEVYELANSIPNLYGQDFNGIDLSVGGNNKPVEGVILNSFESICKGFLSQYATASSGGGFFSAENPRPNLTILVGVIGLEEEKKEWISQYRKGITVVSYNELRRPLAQEYYERWRPGNRGPYRLRYPYDDEFAEYNFFSGEDTTYSYTSRRYGIGISFSDYIRYRDPLFDITMKKAEDMIYDLLIAGQPVVFDARNLEREDRNRLQTNLKRRIESKIQSDFLDEFNLLIDGRYYNKGQWTEEQRQEYDKRIRELLGVTFSMKIFDYEDIFAGDLDFFNFTELRESEIIDQEIVSSLLQDNTFISELAEFQQNSPNIETYKEYPRDNNKAAYLKKLLYNKVIENYDTEYLKEEGINESYDPRLIRLIVDTQIRRFQDDKRDRERSIENPRAYRDNYSLITI